ncbi:DUF4198 domain-containing protein [Pseudaestuariivita atlantica]|uniref:Nickel transporter n=1 Tax=Pseudaestuariivita atlantica TaxID=1317121 RepID=A0A0L1JSG7_9RHOB|nr:DUF4198 domain-containing protein [Pseudaestuariivita atlantica]KNG94729.1 hypothetical protein ATO11_04885 [Pseudaestuariivita atlantica]
MRTLLTRLAAVALLAAPASAHELWIEPRDYQVAPGEQVMADIHVGELMDGPSYAYLPRDFRRFDLVQNGTVTPVQGRMGDRPALQKTVDTPGLVSVVYVTRDLSLTYTKFEKFLKFARHKDFGDAEGAHKARGLSTEKFREQYVRYAKSLVAVGDGAGADGEAGMETEIVALANPYTDDLTDGMPVKVLYQGAPRGDAQVELFTKFADDTVVVTLHRTDADGVAILPVAPGQSYLADAVVLRPLDPADDKAPVWETLWASLTFAVPAR